MTGKMSQFEGGNTKTKMAMIDVAASIGRLGVAVADSATICSLQWFMTNLDLLIVVSMKVQTAGHELISPPD